MSTPTEWKLLRTKADETVDDTDFVGTNTTISIPTFTMPSSASADGRPFTGIEVVVLGVTAGRVPVNRVAGTVTLNVVEAIDRSNPGNGGTVGDAAMNVDLDPTLTATCLLQRKVYFPLNGGVTATIVISADAALPGTVTDLQIWWRAVSR